MSQEIPEENSAFNVYISINLIWLMTINSTSYVRAPRELCAEIASSPRALICDATEAMSASRSSRTGP